MFFFVAVVVQTRSTKALASKSPGYKSSILPLNFYGPSRRLDNEDLIRDRGRKGSKRRGKGACC